MTPDEFTHELQKARNHAPHFKRITHKNPKQNNKTEEFITKARKIHGETYNYSKVQYKNSNTKVIIICPEHGEFQQSPHAHINNKSGCPQCGRAKSVAKHTKNTETFIAEANKIHNSFYNYSKTAYKNNDTKIIITCPIHGDFKQTPNNHIHCKSGCPKCAANQKLTTNEFIQRTQAIYGNAYDYSHVNYKDSNTHVTVICLIHGPFQTIPNNHINNHTGCPNCTTPNTNNTSTTEEFIKKAESVHEKTYDYTKTQYTNYNTPLTITCKIHGEFQQSPRCHLRGSGCPKCGAHKAHAATISKPEEQLYQMLQQHFGKTNIEREYKSEQYPFHCDFYIKSRNIYIELNAFWTHNQHWYNNTQDKNTLTQWQQRAHTKPLYKSAIETWTIRDPLKRETARKNNLNYIVFWGNTLKDAERWFQLGCPDGRDWEHEYSWLKPQ